MIRVLHVIGAMDRGGAETMIMNLYRAINRDCVQFDFNVHEDRECDFDQEITDLGGQIYHMPRFNGSNALTYAQRFRRFFSEHDEHMIVHGHIGSSAALYLREAKRAGRFTIAHSHAQNFPLSPSQLAFRILSYPTRFVADFFMACSDEAGNDRFGKRVAEASNFKVLNNGIDLEQYRCDKEIHHESKQLLGYSSETPLIGHVGRFESVKNHEFLLDVFSLVKQEIPNARLVCVGRGSLEESIKQTASEHGLGDAVDFLGVREDVPRLLAAFDAFLFPSLKEGLAIAVIEAQASGLPVLTSTGVPTSAALTDSIIRMPLAEGSQQWAHACVNMLGSEEDRKDQVDEVRGHGFDIEQSAQWLYEFYEKTTAWLTQ